MDLVNNLLTATPKRDGRTMKIVEVFGDQPEVLDAIVAARTERGLSFQVIADVISKTGHTISDGAVQNFLRSRGVR